jgi:hypothetical protein
MCHYFSPIQPGKKYERLGKKEGFEFFPFLHPYKTETMTENEQQ